MIAAIYLGIGTALLAYWWPPVTKSWIVIRALLVLLAWPAIMVIGLYLIQNDRYEARRRGW